MSSKEGEKRRGGEGEGKEEGRGLREKREEKRNGEGEERESLICAQ